MQYFKHMTSMRHDIKIKRLISKFGLEGYGLYNLIIESIVENISTESPLPELSETCEDMAEFYNGNTAKINEIVAFMLNQGLFELNEITGRVLCGKVYKFLEQSQTRSKEIRDLIAQYKTVTDCLRPSQTKVIEQEEEQEKNKKKKRTEQEQDAQPDSDDYLLSFDLFWITYDKKVERSKCEKLWKKINPDTYELILTHAEEYVRSTPDKQYRKNPETYLFNKCWNDEIVWKDGKPQSNIQDKLKANEDLFNELP